MEALMGKASAVKTSSAICWPNGFFSVPLGGWVKRFDHGDFVAGKGLRSSIFHELMNPFFAHECFVIVLVVFPFELMNLHGFVGRKFDDFYLLQQIFSKNRFGTLPKKNFQPSHGIWGGFKLTTSSSCWKTINSPMQQESGYVLEVAYEKLENPPQPKNKKDHWTLVCWFDWKNLPIFQGTKISFLKPKKMKCCTTYNVPKNRWCFRNPAITSLICRIYRLIYRVWSISGGSPDFWTINSVSLMKPRNSPIQWVKKIIPGPNVTPMTLGKMVYLLVN